MKMTRQTYEAIQAEIDRLTGELNSPKVRYQFDQDDLVRDLGYSYNPVAREYDRKFDEVAKQIAYYEELISHAEIVEEADNEKVGVHKIVTLSISFDEEAPLTEVFYLKNFDIEPNVEGLQSITTLSPIGKAIVGHSIGDKVVVKIPAGTANIIILDIEKTLKR